MPRWFQYKFSDGHVKDLVGGAILTGRRFASAALGADPSAKRGFRASAVAYMGPPVHVDSENADRSPVFVSVPDLNDLDLGAEGEWGCVDIPLSSEIDCRSNLSVDITVIRPKGFEYSLRATVTAADILKRVLRGLNTLGWQLEVLLGVDHCMISFDSSRHRYSRLSIKYRRILQSRSRCNSRLSGLQRLSRRVIVYFTAFRSFIGEEAECDQSRALADAEAQKCQNLEAILA